MTTATILQNMFFGFWYVLGDYFIAGLSAFVCIGLIISLIYLVAYR